MSAQRVNIDWDGDRVAYAKQEKYDYLCTLCSDNNVPFPPQQVFIRSFKREKVLEIWANTADQTGYVLLKAYENCHLSGELGPKRAQGDMQVPEGFYYINDFNPISDYFLSLGINYPNRSDLIYSDAADPGGDIYIHGNCASIGCIPITDEYIMEVYLLCYYASLNGQHNIPVHIFPFVMSYDNIRRIKREYADEPALLQFWDNLFPGYRKFEVYHIPPDIQINDDGNYMWVY